ncbi:MAG: DUF45 domain-containing protein, partial [Robiginitomaculum sp.]|nr:DUF45 domain-containing protein [Robiginitomaculum sp.]
MATFFSKLNTGLLGKKPKTKLPEISRWVDDHDPRIFYQLRPRAKRITIKIDAAKREVVATVPRNAKNLPATKRFVAEKYDWILVQLEALVPPQPFVDGGYILFRGENYRLVCPGPRGHPYVDIEAKQIIIPARPDTFSGRAKRLLIREAREALSACSYAHAHTLGRGIEKISVRDTASRWGSCLK